MEDDGLDWPFRALMIVIIAAIVGGTAWLFISQQMDLKAVRAREAAATAAAPYKVDNTVRSRVGGFRGVVIYADCLDSCRYLVRFPTASMEPQWVRESEIERSR